MQVGFGFAKVFHSKIIQTPTCKFSIVWWLWFKLKWCHKHRHYHNFTDALENCADVLKKQKTDMSEMQKKEFTAVQNVFKHIRRVHKTSKSDPDYSCSAIGHPTTQACPCCRKQLQNLARHKCKRKKDIEEAASIESEGESGPIESNPSEH